jgi:transcriptional regulator with XRE-family HTH domain
MSRSEKATDIDRILGQKLRALRKERKISMKALEKATGVSGAQLSMYEIGKNRISLGRLALICKAMKVPLRDVMQEIDILTDPLETPKPRNSRHSRFAANAYKLVQQFPEIAISLNRLILSYNRDKNNEE